MAYEHQPGQGTLGKAKNKTKDTSPDFTGKIKIPLDAVPGQEYWLSGWEKTASNGGTFTSLRIGQAVQAQGAPVYSAAHKTFDNAVTLHDRAKANAFVLDDKDGDVPF